MAHRSNNLRRRLLTLLALGGTAVSARAQPAPGRTTRLVVPFPPGGTVDVIARILAQRLSEADQQPVIVENRAGANGNIGTEAVARSPADGSTILVAPTSFLVNPLIYRQAGYHPVRDFVPVALLAQLPNVLVVGPSATATSVAQLLQQAQARPGQLSYGSSGAGSTQHLGAEMLKRAGRVDLLHVPYKGAAPAMAAVASGEITLMVTAIPAVSPLIKAGKLRALAVTSLSRTDSLPDVPTLDESGLRGFSASNWIGAWLPAGAALERVLSLHRAFQTALAMPAVRAQFAGLGAEPGGGTPKDFAALIERETPRYAALVRELDLRID